MENKNLNEGIVEDILKNSEKTIADISNEIPDELTILKSLDKSKSKKKSIFSEQEINPLQNTNPISIVPSSIPIVPKSLSTIKKEKEEALIVEEENKRARKNEIINSHKAQAQIKNKSENMSEEDFQNLNSKTKQEIEEITNKVLPDTVNYVQLTEEVQEAFENIPGAESGDISLVDLNVIESAPIQGSGKTGNYFKTKVSIKKENIPNQINIIASLVKKKSNGLIFPRVCDLRVIGNTNKTQLKNFQLKLTMASVVFKPDFAKLKVNKGTRIIISIPEDYSVTGNLLVYIQESRAKNIFEIKSNDFATIEDLNEFISKIIVNYYNAGYTLTAKKLEFYSAINPLMPVIDTVLNDKEYKIKPYTNDNGKVFCVDFYSKGLENQWLYVQILESVDFEQMYDIYAKNLADQTWEHKITTKPVTVKQLNVGFLKVLSDCYKKDWTNQLGIKEDDKFYYFLAKLTHNKLRKVLIELNDISESNKEIGLRIGETLSKKDTAKSINPDYDAEAIIGKTNFLDYFILTFLAYQIKGGDSRKSSEYITKPDYIEKYGIKNPLDFNERKRIKTIDESGNQRNYNSRIYLFQLEFSINNIKHIYRDLTFEEVLNATHFLTADIKTPVTKY